MFSYAGAASHRTEGIRTLEATCQASSSIYDRSAGNAHPLALSTPDIPTQSPDRQHEHSAVRDRQGTHYESFSWALLSTPNP